jgi:hypothetical protein
LTLRQISEIAQFDDLARLLAINPETERGVIGFYFQAPLSNPVKLAVVVLVLRICIIHCFGGEKELSRILF